MTEETLKEVEAANDLARSRDADSYDTYIEYCSWVQVPPAPYNIWITIKDRGPLP